MVNIDIDSLTNRKTNQLNDNDSNQLYIKLVTNDDINNRFIIYHQNIRGLKGKINEFMLSLPAEAPLSQLALGCLKSPWLCKASRSFYARKDPFHLLPLGYRSGDWSGGFVKVTRGWEAY
jgi:hypothetical protein